MPGARCFPGFSERNNHPFSANPKVRHQSKGLHCHLASSLDCWTAVDLLSGICQLLLWIVAPFILTINALLNTHSWWDPTLSERARRIELRVVELIPPVGSLGRKFHD